MKKRRSSLVVLAALAAASVGAAPQRPRILGVSHLALYVHDLAASRAFYTKFLGYEEVAPGLIGITNWQYLELVADREAGTDRLARVGVETDDAEGMRAYLKSRGVAVPGKVATDRIGSTTFEAVDPDGHALAFVQYPPGGWRAREKSGGAAALSTDMRHIGILVGALDPAMAFYRDTLGFREIWRGSRDEKELNWVNMQVPDGQDYIEFMLYRDLPEPSKRGTQHHLCLFVPDIEKSLAALRARTAEVSYTRAMQINTGTNRKRQLNVYDPDGTRIEFMEPVPLDGKPAPSSAAPPPRRN